MLFDNLQSGTDWVGARPDDSLPVGFDTTSTPRRVVIVGAGMAGLVAAYELDRAGHDVVVIEARKRVGGRIFTQRSADGSVLAEAGAGRIPTSHRWTNHYLAKMSLLTEPLIPDGLRTLAHVDGHSWVDGQTDLPGFTDLIPDERGIGFPRLVQKAFGTELARLRKMSRVERTGAFAAISVLDHLREQGFSERAIALLTVGVFPRDIALGSLLEALEHLHGSVMHRVSGGNDLLPSSLAAAIACRVQLDAKVTAITQAADGVELLLEASGEMSRHFADAVLCTVPFSVIDSISFDPPLSEEKRLIIAQLHYAPASKVYLQMRRAYWETSGANGFAKLDRARELWAPRLCSREDGAVIQLYAQGAEALALDALDEAERVLTASALVARIFPEAAELAVSGASYSWQEDVWARGAYVVRTTADAGLSAELIGRREGRLYFAGEHASEYPGWIEGAIRSGYSAARAIHDAGNGMKDRAEAEQSSG